MVRMISYHRLSKSIIYFSHLMMQAQFWNQGPCFPLCQASQFKNLVATTFLLDNNKGITRKIKCHHSSKHKTPSPIGLPHWQKCQNTADSFVDATRALQLQFS